MNEEGEVCKWCGDPVIVALFEAWGHEFQIETCCETRHHYVSRSLAEDARDAAGIMRALGAEELLGRRLRGIANSEPSLRLDYRIETGPIRFATAKAFVLAHHAHCRPPAGWKFGLGCWNGATLVGVAMIGRPVARKIDASRVLEVNRLCLDRTIPDALRYNVSSKLYGAAARGAKARGYHKIITYTLASESGASLRAAGWSEDGRTRGGGWSRPSRSRPNPTPIEPKVRWARTLRA